MTSAVRAPRPSIPNPLAGMDDRRRQLVLLGIVALVAIVYPLVYRSLESAAPFIPWPGTAVLIYCATFAILALGLNIVMGFAGLLDLGYVAFYAIGAYTTAFLASPHFGIHISWWIVVWHRGRPSAAVFGILLGAPDAEAARRLPGHRDPRIRRDRPTSSSATSATSRFALPAFLGGAILIGPNANLTGGNVGHQPDRPADHPDTRAMGQPDRVLQPEPDRVVGTWSWRCWP